MRLPLAFALAAGAALLAAPTARACEPVVTECLPALVVFPAYTPEGDRIGTVEARVRRLPPLQRSRFTGQPITVMFNNPGTPGVVDPGYTLMPLLRAKRYRTQAVYPQGY